MISPRDKHNLIVLITRANLCTWAIRTLAAIFSLQRCTHWVAPANKSINIISSSLRALSVPVRFKTPQTVVARQGIKSTQAHQIKSKQEWRVRGVEGGGGGWAGGRLIRHWTRAKDEPVSRSTKSILISRTHDHFINVLSYHRTWYYPSASRTAAVHKATIKVFYRETTKTHVLMLF